MKRSSLIVSLALSLAISSGAAYAGGPDWLKDAVFYQIYPSSYMDSDGNGIGDIPGITSKLDYIRDLGVTAIWLNPVYVSGWTDGGYDVIDFYKVDPRFGTNTDMVTLTKEAHKRGIKVCLDLVAGHTSDLNEWFLQSKQGKDMRYSDYYIWTDEISQEEKDQIKRRYEQEDPKASTIGRFVEANAPRGKYYEKNYYESQPALNYGYANPDPTHPWEQSVDAPGPRATRQELKNIMTFWFDKGIDGFRVDLASSLIKNDDQQKSATSKLWQEMRSWRDTNYPDRVLIAEWFNPKQSIPAGFDMDFFRAGGPRRPQGPGAPAPVNLTGESTPESPAYFDLAGKGSIKQFIANYTDQYESTKAIGYMAFPTGNHDNPRVSYAPRTTPEQLKVVMTMFLTLPGIPFIYYGDEIGMKYLPGITPKEGSRDRAGTRTPMQWENNPTAGFSTAAVEDLYFPVDTENGRITVEKQKDDPTSLLNYVKRLLSLRREYSALGNLGDWEYVGDVDKPYPMLYKRTDGKEVFFVALNPGSSKVSASIDVGSGKLEVVEVTGSAKFTKTKKGDKINLGGCSAAVFKLID